MERRKFLKTSAAGSACLFAGSVAAESLKQAEAEAKYACKITVLKKSLNSEWSKEFRNFEGEVCDVFTEGQEFVVESPWSPPEGFCPWAWADIRTFIHVVNSGEFESFVSCCTDGFRPVFFRIERITTG